MRPKIVLWFALALVICPLAVPDDASTTERLVGGLVSRVPANIVGAQTETGILAKVLKSVTGISIRDIERYDWKGDPNSIINNPCGAVCRDVGLDWKPPWAPKAKA